MCPSATAVTDKMEERAWLLNMLKSRNQGTQLLSELRVNYDLNDCTDVVIHQDRDKRMRK